MLPAPPRKILLATDLSARCDRALDRAALLASEWNAELFAVHAVERSDDAYANDLELHVPAWRRSHDARLVAEERLRRDLEQCAVKIHTIVERGEPLDVVLAAIDTQGCGLVVTGIARDETLGRFGLGTTVHGLVRRSPVPVLVVRERARRRYANVVVASDFSTASRHVLRTAAALFPQRSLQVFHAYDTRLAGLVDDPASHDAESRQGAAREYRDLIAAGDLGDAASRCTLVVERGPPDLLLQQYAYAHDVDVVVVGARGGSALAHVLLGSTAAEVLEAVTCDVLVVRGS
ncbi:MAG TPA: universal stress protein [Gammaproteobacteria bacterium]|jgi:nucleotide-binding universal stress UspA family protein|nr:universal stress protein [Gammaproteobacteria bacterium]